MLHEPPAVGAGRGTRAKRGSGRIVQWHLQVTQLLSIASRGLQSAHVKSAHWLTSGTSQARRMRPLRRLKGRGAQSSEMPAAVVSVQMRQGSKRVGTSA